MTVGPTMLSRHSGGNRSGKRARTQLVRERSSAVVSAGHNGLILAKEWNKYARADLQKTKPKTKQKTNKHFFFFKEEKEEKKKEKKKKRERRKQKRTKIENEKGAGRK